MNTAVKVTLGVILVGGLAVGGELLYLHHRNEQDATMPRQTAYKSDPDDLVYLKQQHPMSLKDEKDLKGQSIWVSAAGQLDYYPYNGKKIDFDKSEGVLLGAEKMDIQDAVEAVAPKKTAFRIPQGDKQIFLIFTKPNDSARAGKVFAVAVGYVQNGDYNYLTDQIFFYDDPHKLFSYWGPQVWQAIDEHKAIPGMTEREVQLALGQVSEPHGDTAGDRMVTYDDQGHPKNVTFEHGKATKIENVGS